ncbi:hypothetical protein HYQ46_000632 [Verticillium longisporum]|nr:hypothetical protein HYQ46_000632 [Verticillium longisporum]
MHSHFGTGDKEKERNTATDAGFTPSPWCPKPSTTTPGLGEDAVGPILLLWDYLSQAQQAISHLVLFV